MVQPDYPGEPFDARELLARIISHVRARVRGDEGGVLESILAPLLLAFVQWLTDGTPFRGVLIAPTGSGKTHIARTLAEASGVPAVILSVTDMAESSWTGPQIGDALARLLAEPLPPADSAGWIRVPTDPVAARGLLVLDEIDKIALVSGTGARHTRESASWRSGRQESLLPALDPLGVVTTTVSRGSGPLRIRTSGLAVLALGAFPMLAHDATPCPRDLVALGFLSELVDRMGALYRLPPLGATTQAHMLHARLDHLRGFANSLGVPAALDAVDARVAELDPSRFAGPRGWLAAAEHAARQMIADALIAQVGSGSHDALQNGSASKPPSTTTQEAYDA